MIVVEGLHDGRPDLAGADEEDPHERVAYFGSRRAYTRWLPCRDASSRPSLAAASASSFAPPSPGRRSAPRARSGASSSRAGSTSRCRSRPAERAATALRGRAARDDPRHRQREAADRVLPRHPQSRTAAGGEQGLLGLAFDPQYATNRFIYVNYTDTSGDTRVVRYRTNGTRAIPSTARVLLGVDQPYSNHNGGGLAFGPDGCLYVGTGDGGSGGDPENRAQNMASPLGKMLRLDVRRPGSAPEIVGARAAQPVALLVRSADGRPLHRRRRARESVEEVDYTPRSSPGSRTTAGTCTRARAGSRRRAPGPASSSSRSSSTATSAAAPSSAATSTAGGAAGRAGALHLR